MDWLIILYFVLFAFLSRLNIRLATLLLIAILPTYLIRFSIFGLPSTLLEVSIIIAFLSWIIDNRSNLFKVNKDKKEKRNPYPFGWEIILALIISFISIFVGGITLGALGIFKAYFLEPIFIFILALNTIKGEKGTSQIILALMFSALTVSLVAIWQKITGQFIFNEFWANPENRRVVSFFGYPNAVALYLGPIIPLMAGLFIAKLKEKGGIKNFFQQLLLFITIILSFLSIFFSQSKGALLALTISLGVAIFILLKKKLKIILIILTIGIISLFIYFQKDWINLKLSSSLSYQIRQAQWSETWKMLIDGNLIWGSGLDNYQEKIYPYHQEGIFFNKDSDLDFKRKIIIFDDKYRQERWQPLEIYLYPHNIFLNFWTELGLAGMLLFVFIICKFLILSLIQYKKNKGNKNKFISLALFSSMLMIVIHGLFDVPYFKNDLSILFWLLITILAILKTQKKAIKIWKKT